MSLADLTFNSGDYKLYLSMRMAFWVKLLIKRAHQNIKNCALPMKR